MKAKELQIGDWIQNTYGNIGRVIGFHFCPHSESNEVVIRYNSNSTCWSEEQMLNPIPLTEEILEKNGFISYPMDRIVIWRNEYSFAIECDPTTWEYYWANGDVRIDYIHELQHALRLCGLNELADNFKVG